MSLRKPITPAVRDQLADDPYMKICVLASEECKGGLEWHHGTLGFGETYRRDEWWSISPLCKYHHAHASRPEYAERIRASIKQRRLTAEARSDQR